MINDKSDIKPSIEETKQALIEDKKEVKEDPKKVNPQQNPVTDEPKQNHEVNESKQNLEHKELKKNLEIKELKQKPVIGEPKQSPMNFESNLSPINIESNISPVNNVSIGSIHKDEVLVGTKTYKSIRPVNYVQETKLEKPKKRGHKSQRVLHSCKKKKPTKLPPVYRNKGWSTKRQKKFVKSNAQVNRYF